MEGQTRGGLISSSSLKKIKGSQGIAQLVPEESGWTQYFEDFSADQREEQSSYSDDSFGNKGSPSLVSDAASPTHHGSLMDMPKFNNNKEIIACSAISGQHFPKRLNIVKKKRTNKYSCDDLEDTASSPVNSPKVSSLKRMDCNHRRMDDSIGNFLEKSSTPDPLPQSDERSSINFDGKNNDFVDLKKRGLCVMPFSMLVNYLG